MKLLRQVRQPKYSNLYHPPIQSSVFFIEIVLLKYTVAEKIIVEIISLNVIIFSSFGFILRKDNFVLA